MNLTNFRLSYAQLSLNNTIIKNTPLYVSTKFNNDNNIHQNEETKILKSIQNAKHIDSKTKTKAQYFLDNLIKHQSLTEIDFNDNRDAIVSGIQFAMESVMGGREYIITETLPTPLKNAFNELQMARRNVIEKRVKNKKPLHLFFYKDTITSKKGQQEYQNYQNDFFAKYGVQTEQDKQNNINYPVLFEHQLDRDESIPKFSGAVILNEEGNSFIIEACQVHQTTELSNLANQSNDGIKIKLFYGKLDINATEFASIKYFIDKIQT
jgi:hypothetical protein